MEVRDLMLGDWIEDGYKKSQVTSITCDGIVETTAAISNIEVVDPIPLTEEILVKNGFEKFAESQTLFDYTDNDIHLEYWIGDGCFRYYTAEIHYVHQLQHLLRLCGVEKELVID